MISLYPLSQMYKSQIKLAVVTDEGKKNANYYFMWLEKYYI